MKPIKSVKKKYIIGIIVALFIIIDFIVLLYPTVSDYINSRSQSRVVVGYFNDVTTMDTSQTKAMLAAAAEYNKSLIGNTELNHFTAAQTAEYDAQLNTSSGVMGILEIDKINVKLPVYHGTSAGVLQVGVGHIQGTSLPIGGIGTHAAISGHTGLPSSLLLTDLTKMANGDTFVIYILGETLTYQVDQIKTVLPDDTNNLGIDPDKDYVTLVTCTPYGINDHRLLVRGHRIANAPKSDWKTVYADAQRLDKIMIILIFIIPILPILIIYGILKFRKIHKKRNIQ